MKHPGRSIIAFYLGQLAAAIALLHAPEVLVMGGGVLADGSLLPLIRESTQTWLAGYLPHLHEPAAMQALIRAPALHGDSAISGAVLLALAALDSQKEQPA